MAHLLYFRGEGYGMMQGITEYIELAEEDELVPEETAMRTAPGFQLHSSIEINGDVTAMPCSMTLVPLLQVRPPVNPRTLPRFFGLTVDCRLREFRRVGREHGLESIPFNSDQGRRLLERLVLHVLGGY